MRSVKRARGTGRADLAGAAAEIRKPVALQEGGAMDRTWPFVVPGVIVVLVGLGWMLRGFNILGG